MVADRPGPTFPEPPRGQQRPPGVISETDRHLRGMATALGKLSAELPKVIEKAAGSHAADVQAVGAHVEAATDQVATEISDLTAAVRELTELIKEIPMFPREPWGRTRRVLRWCFNR